MSRSQLPRATFEAIYPHADDVFVTARPLLDIFEKIRRNLTAQPERTFREHLLSAQQVSKVSYPLPILLYRFAKDCWDWLSHAAVITREVAWRFR